MKDSTLSPAEYSGEAGRYERRERERESGAELGSWKRREQGEGQ